MIYFSLLALSDVIDKLLQSEKGKYLEIEKLSTLTDVFKASYTNHGLSGSEIPLSLYGRGMALLEEIHESFYTATKTLLPFTVSFGKKKRGKKLTVFLGKVTISDKIHQVIEEEIYASPSRIKSPGNSPKTRIFVLRQYLVLPTLYFNSSTLKILANLLAMGFKKETGNTPTQVEIYYVHPKSER